MWAEPEGVEIWSRALEEHGYHVTPSGSPRKSDLRDKVRNRDDVARVLQATQEQLRREPFPRDMQEEAEFFRRFDSEVLRRLSIPADPAILDTISLRFQQDLIFHVFDDVLPVLKDLQGAGYRLGIVSNATHQLPGMLRDAGLTEYFEVVTYSYEAGVEKPDPRIFELALSRMGAGPERAVHIGDSYEADVVGARRAGVSPFLIYRRDEDQRRDCTTLRTLREILDHV